MYSKSSSIYCCLYWVSFKTTVFVRKYLMSVKTCKRITINVKKIAFENKEHTADQKMGVSVLLRLFISSNEVCNTAYALYRIHEQNSIFKCIIMGPMIPKQMKYNLHYGTIPAVYLDLKNAEFTIVNGQYYGTSRTNRTMI